MATKKKATGVRKSATEVRAKRGRKLGLPPIPKEVVTAVGPIDIEWATGILESEECVGKFDWRSRTIILDDKLSLHAAWATLLHEVCHSTLLDSGIVNFPDRDAHGVSELEERICDAIAAARIAEMIAKSV